MNSVTPRSVPTNRQARSHSPISNTGQSSIVTSESHRLSRGSVSSLQSDASSQLSSGSLPINISPPVPSYLHNQSESSTPELPPSSPQSNQPSRLTAERLQQLVADLKRTSLTDQSESTFDTTSPVSETDSTHKSPSHQRTSVTLTHDDYVNLIDFF